MSRNLKSKLGDLLEDVDTLNRPEAIRKLELFINEELKFMESEHVIGRYDLNLIKSNAMQYFQEYDARLGNTQSDLDNFRAWCYIQAVVGFLRSQGLLSSRLNYDKNKK